MGLADEVGRQADALREARTAAEHAEASRAQLDARCAAAAAGLERVRREFVAEMSRLRVTEPTTRVPYLKSTLRGYNKTATKKVRGWPVPMTGGLSYGWFIGRDGQLFTVFDGEVRRVSDRDVVGYGEVVLDGVTTAVGPEYDLDLWTARLARIVAEYSTP